jgi:hypothetical protein
MWWCLGSLQESIDFQIVKFYTDGGSEYMELSMRFLFRVQLDLPKSPVVALPGHAEA